MLILPPLDLHPELLTSPILPKPLHGLNPRSIDPDWWKQEKKKTIVRTWDRCEICGAFGKSLGGQWLECHEEYHIDWGAGRATYIDCHPLCHQCHNFIHSARLQVIMGKEKTETEVKLILEHGFKILADNHLPAFPFTLMFATQVGADTFEVLPYDFEIYPPEWGDWRLEFRGKLYSPRFATEAEWADYYRQLNQERNDE